MLESPATDPGRAADQMMRDALANTVGEALVAAGPGMAIGCGVFELVADRLIAGPLAQLQADLIAARKERDEATRLLRVLNEETVLAGYPCGDRDQTLANVRVLRSDLVALAKMYGEACGELARTRSWLDQADRYADACEENQRDASNLVAHLSRQRKAAEAEAAQLRARLHEAEKGKTVDLDTAMKRGIRSWSAKLHIPVTRMMSRVLREEIHAALTPAPDANQEAGDGR